MKTIQNQIEHLPIIKREENPTLKAIEIAELTCRESISPETRFGTIPQKIFPTRKVLNYIAGKTEEGEIVGGYWIKENNEIVEAIYLPTQFGNYINYKTISQLD